MRGVAQVLGYKNASQKARGEVGLLCFDARVDTHERILRVCRQACQTEFAVVGVEKRFNAHHGADVDPFEISGSKLVGVAPRLQESVVAPANGDGLLRPRE